MNIVLTDSQKASVKNIAAIIIIALVCSIATYQYTAKYYQGKLDALNLEYNTFKATYATVIDDKEKAVIAVAKAEKAAGVPLKEYIKGDTIVKTEYVEKATKNDASIEVTNKVNPIVVSYNGKKQELPTTNLDGTAIVDGKTVITQETTSTLDIDSIVKREIANTVLGMEHEQAVLKRQKTQQTVWGTLIGVGVGYAASTISK